LNPCRDQRFGAAQIGAIIRQIRTKLCFMTSSGVPPKVVCNTRRVFELRFAHSAGSKSHRFTQWGEPVGNAMGEPWAVKRVQLKKIPCACDGALPTALRIRSEVQSSLNMEPGLDASQSLRRCAWHLLGFYLAAMRVKSRCRAPVLVRVTARIVATPFGCAPDAGSIAAVRGH
jgi:hypothetical protein